MRKTGGVQSRDGTERLGANRGVSDYAPLSRPTGLRAGKKESCVTQPTEFYCPLYARV